MKMKWATAFLLLFLVSLQLTAQRTITIATLLDEMTDFTAVARFPLPAFQMKQASSYDRRSVAPDKPGWFANGDFNQFIREEKKHNRSEFVMMDADAPGAIVRFWLTTLAKPGTLRFYFDNEKEPSLVIPAFDLMRAGFDLGPALLQPHSSYEREGKGGNTLYLPVPYQQHCKVTWEFADSANKKTPHYYQINYRSYPPGTSIETFSTKLPAKYRKQIDQAEKKLWNPESIKSRELSKQIRLKPGSEESFDLPKGNHAISQLLIELKNLPPADPGTIFRSVLLKISFDGHTTVLCPLGDFAGSGYGGKLIKSWYRELTDSSKLISRWVMPYRNSATVTLINKSNAEVSLSTKVSLSTFKWDDRTMYFHTTYKYEQNIWDAKWDYDPAKNTSGDSLAPIEWNFATIKGKGVYLGNTLAVNNRMNSTLR